MMGGRMSLEMRSSQARTVTDILKTVKKFRFKSFPMLQSPKGGPSGGRCLPFVTNEPKHVRSVTVSSFTVYYVGNRAIV